MLTENRPSEDTQDTKRTGSLKQDVAVCASVCLKLVFPYLLGSPMARHAEWLHIYGQNPTQGLGVSTHYVHLLSRVPYLYRDLEGGSDNLGHFGGQQGCRGLPSAHLSRHVLQQSALPIH